MGCGQSKINLYPRRNKSSGKGQNGKKSGGADSKDGEEEETASGENHVSKDAESHPKDKDEVDIKLQKEKPKVPVPPHGLGHAAASAEISASQQDFFKMLDEKIEKGRDYDSSSETEIQMEQARITSLLMHWESASQSSSQCNHSSPPTPSRRRQNSQDRQSSIQYQSIDQPRSPDMRRNLKGQQILSQMQSNSQGSPPSRRSHTSPYQSQDYPDKQLSDYENNSPPIKRAQSANPNWKVNPKSATYNPKAIQKIESYDDQRCYSPNLLSQREIHQSYGVSQEYLDTSRESSQITYNPTFQSHSPAHGPKVGNSQAYNNQPYIAQIITYPMSQQAVSFHNPSKYISQPPTYQQQPGPSGVQKYPGRAQLGMNPTQPNIYYIAPTAMVPQPMPEQVLTPKQQTALHLQQYVAMKQAQQALGYSQRITTGQTSQDFSQYSSSPTDSTYSRKMYERSDENYSLNFMPVGIRQPITQKPVNPRPISPGIVQLQQNIGQGINMQPYNQLVQRAQGVQPIQGFQNRPGCTASLGRNQPLNQKEIMTADRYGLSNPTSNSSSPQSSISSRNNLCQSLNIMTQKTVGQIVPVSGQDLVIFQNLPEAETRIRSADLGNVDNGSLSKNILVGDGNHGREQFFTVPSGEQCQIVNQTVVDTKSVSKQHLGSNIVGRQMYYSQVVTGLDQKVSGNTMVNDIGAKKSSSESSIKGSRTANQKTSDSNSSTSGFL